MDNSERSYGNNSFSHSSDACSVKEVAEELNIPIPPEYICPLTDEIMMYPVMTIKGLNFERDAIIVWFESGNTVCPVTKEPLKLSDLVPNRALENKIAFWKFENTLPDGESMSPTKQSQRKNQVFGIATPTSEKKEKAFLRAMVAKKIMDNTIE